MKRISSLLIIVFCAVFILAETYKTIKPSEVKTYRQVSFRCDSSRGQLWLTFLAPKGNKLLTVQLSTKERSYRVIDCVGDKNHKKLYLRDNETGQYVLLTFSRKYLTELLVDMEEFNGSPINATLGGAFMMNDGPYCRFLFGKKAVEEQNDWRGGSIDDFFVFLETHFERE